MNSYYIHNLSPFAWQFTETLGVRWYGLAYALGLLWGWGILIFLANQKRMDLDAKDRAGFIFAILLGIIIGGRLGFLLLYDWSSFSSNPLVFFEFWNGGMASHGGMIGVAIAIWAFSRKHSIKFWQLTDIVCFIAPMGLLLGRIANFINGELWGKITQVSWAVIFPKSAPEGTPLSLIAPRHPSQLYEAALEGLFLLIYTAVRYLCFPKIKPGKLTAEFLILYALVRIIGEMFREPDAALIFGVSRGIFYSAIMIPVGIGLWIWAQRQKED